MVALGSLLFTLRNLPWSFGGGTAMRLVLDHRDSKDIEIFVTDPYVISGLSPRLNDTTDRLTGDYEEQSNYLKLRFPEGEIDFIVGAKAVADVAFEKRAIRGCNVDLEMPIEIVAKKCLYRADRFAARDIFDLAVLIHEEPQTVDEHRDILLARRDALERRLGVMRAPGGLGTKASARPKIARESVQEALDRVQARPSFRWVTSTAIETVLRFLD